MRMTGFGLLVMFIGLFVVGALVAIVVWAVIYFPDPVARTDRAMARLARFSISATPGARLATRSTSGSATS